MTKYSLDEINQMTAASCLHALSQVYEHSPWVIEKALEARPFSHIKVLQAACEGALYAAPVERQIELIRAHPDLAAKLDQLPKLTDFSQAEQKRAGFAALSEETLASMRMALAEYRERFGHPFILCVTEHPAEDVLPLLQLRVTCSPDAERVACLTQIARIGWHRICSLIVN